MKKNRGFTLIELVIIIGLLAVFAVIFSINFTGVLSNSKDNNKNDEYNEILLAADAYVALNSEIIDPLYDGTASSVELDVRDLKNSGFLSVSTSNNITIIITKKSDETLIFEIE